MIAHVGVAVCAVPVPSLVVTGIAISGVAADPSPVVPTANNCSVDPVTTCCPPCTVPPSGCAPPAAALPAGCMPQPVANTASRPSSAKLARRPESARRRRQTCGEEDGRNGRLQQGPGRLQTWGNLRDPIRQIGKARTCAVQTPAGTAQAVKRATRQKGKYLAVQGLTPQRKPKRLIFFLKISPHSPFPTPVRATGTGTKPAGHPGVPPFEQSPEPLSALFSARPQRGGVSVRTRRMNEVDSL